MAGWFDLNKNDKGEFYFVLKAANGEVILTSEMYTGKSGAESGIASVRTHAPDPARYEKKQSTDGKFYFTLKAANHEVIGTSQRYTAAGSLDAGIASVVENGATSTVKGNA